MNEKIDQVAKEEMIAQDYVKHLLYIQENLTVLLHIRDYSVAQIAEAIEISQKAFQNFMDGIDFSKMDMDEFIHISYVLELPLHWIFLQPDKLRAEIENRYKIKLPSKDELREKYARR